MNKLSVEKKAAAVGMLCEGNSIRSVERMTGVHRDTVMRLGVRIGEGCRQIMDDKMRNLPCRLIQVDEVWGVCRYEAKDRIFAIGRAVMLATFGLGLRSILKRSSFRLSQWATVLDTWRITSLKI